MTRHLAVLDAMRGVAALSVLLYHLGHWLNNPWLAANSSLAVDLFFCLSGYVLPLAYWSRRDSLSNADFFRVRAIRLMPMIVLGAILSLAYTLLKITTLHLDVSPATLFVAGAGALLNIPTFGAPHDIGGPLVFPLNGPQYTLFLEFVANLAWWALRNWRLRSLAFALAPISLICLYVFGLGGDTVQNFWLGFPRVAFAFMTGLGLYFFGSKYSPNRVVNVAVLCAAALVSIAAFYWPTGLPNWAQVSWVALVAPLLVLSGARLPLGGLLLRSSLFLGEMSYPIYALHYPIFCWVNGVYRGKFGAQNLGIEAPLVFAAVIAGSYLAKRFFDEPLRRWLSRTTAKKSRTQDVAPPRSSGQQGHREQAIVD